MFAFKLILYFLICLVTSVVAAANEWQLVADKKGITIYQLQQPGFPYKHTKGVITVNAKPAMIFALLNDFTVCDQWIYGCLEGRRQANDDIYLVFKGPPFFKNREVVLHSRVAYLAETGQWLIAVENKPQPKVNDNHVMVRSLQAEWLLTAKSTHETTIEHTFYIDPNVSVKLGANRYNSRAIYRTLLQMPKMLELSKYQSEQELPKSLKKIMH